MPQKTQRKGGMHIRRGKEKKNWLWGKKKYNPPCCEIKIGGIQLFFPTSLKAELKRGRKKILQFWSLECGNCQLIYILNLVCQWAKPSLPMPTLALSTIGILYCWYTLALFNAHHCSASFSLNRFRLQLEEKRH